MMLHEFAAERRDHIMYLQRLGFLTVLLQLSALAWPYAAAAEDSVLVPFVGCPGSGQLGPAAAPAGKPVLAAISPKVGPQLAFYKGAHGQGVFAPVGWYCREWYGSNGYIVVVTPAPPPDHTPAQRVSGAGVEFLFRYGDTSGRFDVADISARFFPDVMRDFIQGVRDEELEPQSRAKPTRYLKDTVKRISERISEFSTPEREAGFGTEGLLAQSDEPVRGVVALNAPSEDTDISVLRVRLPAGQKLLSDAIVEIETHCLVTPQRCELKP
jgi:hypothetical protein